MSASLLLWLESPLQSWGVDSLFSRRDTLPYPSRSAISGLLCCALGAGGEQHQLLRQLNSCTLDVYAYRRDPHSAGPSTVAAGSAGQIATDPESPFRTSSTATTSRDTVPQSLLLRDFHMVGSGYDPKDPWQDLCLLKKIDGKRTSSDSKLTVRYYLQDSAFAAILSGNDALLQRLAVALRSPCWDLYLGRKCCVPSEFIFQGLFSEVEEARRGQAQLATEKRYLLSQMVREGIHDDADHQLSTFDQPLQFGTVKKYAPRATSVFDHPAAGK